eukprot:scaffold5980_cov376-Prasinococcus_capsulatus_cf.AAC.5
MMRAREEARVASYTSLHRLRAPQHRAEGRLASKVAEARARACRGTQSARERKSKGGEAPGCNVARARASEEGEASTATQGSAARVCRRERMVAICKRRLLLQMLPTGSPPAAANTRCTLLRARDLKALLGRLGRAVSKLGPVCAFSAGVCLWYRHAATIRCKRVVGLANMPFARPARAYKGTAARGAREPHLHPHRPLLLTYYSALSATNSALAGSS